MLTEALHYAAENRSRFTDELLDLLRIPSISTLSEHKPDIQRAAEWVSQSMVKAGLKDVRVMTTPGNPVVYGEWLQARSNAPTVLIYGHYDVQPVDPLDLWETPPFEPSIRDGKIYARGASDDKGQMFLHIKALESYLHTAGSLPVNVKMIVEGEEEIGSPNLETFVYEQTDLLSANTSLVSDGRILSSEQPSLVYGLRGLVSMELRVTGPSHDLHSGSYGGSVHNPVQALAEIIAALHDEAGHIQIPGFYDDVRPLTEKERQSLASVPRQLEMWQSETGLKDPWGESEYTLLERTSARPTCEVNGIWGGFQGEGGKTIIPARAGAKISMRIVPDQDPAKIANLFRDYIMTVAPNGVEVEAVQVSAGGWPAITPIDSHEMRSAAAAYESAWGAAPIFTREGGSIPIVSTFQNVLGAPTVLMGFGLDDNIHSPNEHFRLDHFQKGIDTVIHYYHNLAS